jgi:cation-transporting ATPase 13A2
MAESLPTRSSAFTHRRPRADSTTSFSFYQEQREDSPLLGTEHASVEDLDEIPFLDDEIGDDEDSADLERQAPENDYVLHRRSSSHGSRGSQDCSNTRLLRRDSGQSAASGHGGNRVSQKIYMANEDLYIVIAGFRTSRLGMTLYILICVVTFGLGWLFFRWLPRLHVKLVGKSSPLRYCQWVVIEVSLGSRWLEAFPQSVFPSMANDGLKNQWSEMAILNVDARPYGRPMSYVFGIPGKLDVLPLDDEDPIINELRMLNYRYVRFYYHQQKDKFLLCLGWKDPHWTDIRSIRAGIMSDEKSRRDVVFGNNLIDIEQKSTFRLLVDEVSLDFA